MTADVRSLVMLPGHCSFCGQPAEPSQSGAWWHTDESCHPSYGIARGGEVPNGPLGFAAIWPARFIPDSPKEDE